MAFQISRAIDAHQIGYAVAGACALFVVLLLLFELLRTRLYWIYEPRVHRDDYKSKTPPAPGRTPFAWVRCVFEHWSAYEQYAGVDGVVLAHILRYLTDQCLFAAVVGFLVLIPTYVTGDGLSGYGDGYGDKPDGNSSAAAPRLRHGEDNDARSTCSNSGSTPSPWSCSLGAGWPGRTT